MGQLELVFQLAEKHPQFGTQWSQLLQVLQPLIVTLEQMALHHKEVMHRQMI